MNPFPEPVRIFLDANEHADPHRLLLQKSPFPEFAMHELVQQIVGRQKAKVKLPSWYAQKETRYPVKLSMEQCSSEETGKFKAGLFSGERLVDLTGGFGVDTTLMSASFSRADHIEKNEELSAIVAHNFQVFGLPKIRAHCSTAEVFIQQMEGRADLVFIDPSRRDSATNRTVFFADCVPNILEMKGLLFDKTDKILVKASPMLDISQAHRELENVSHTWVVAVQDECKELLFLLEKNQNQPSPAITCVDLRKDAPVLFRFDGEGEGLRKVDCEMPKAYLYEPNVAILKAGAFRAVAEAFGVAKLHANSHLYTSDQFIPDFPGRAFQILAIVKPEAKAVLPYLPNKKSNVAVRNFPLKVVELRKKLGIGEGGEKYVFGTTLVSNEKRLIICEKMR
jgi:predicted O-methyltransferase YrrM